MPASTSMFTVPAFSYMYIFPLLQATALLNAFFHFLIARMVFWGQTVWTVWTEPTLPSSWSANVLLVFRYEWFWFWIIYIHLSMFYLQTIKVVQLKITNSMPYISRTLEERRSFFNVSFKSHAFPTLFLWAELFESQLMQTKCFFYENYMFCINSNSNWRAKNVQNFIKQESIFTLILG